MPDPTLTTRTRHGLNLWGAVLVIEGRRFTVTSAEKTEIDGEYILQHWTLTEDQYQERSVNNDYTRTRNPWQRRGRQ